MGCLTDSHQLGWALGFEEVGLGKTTLRDCVLENLLKAFLIFLEVFNVLNFKHNFVWAHLVEKNVKSLVLKQDQEPSWVSRYPRKHWRAKHSGSSTCWLTTSPLVSACAPPIALLVRTLLSSSCSHCY